MTKIFGTVRTPHPWCNEISNWVSSLTSDFHAGGANLEVDERVSPPRFTSIEAYVAAERSIDPQKPLNEYLGTYFKQKVLTDPNPEFATTINANNVASNVASEVDEGRPLIWLLDLNKLYQIGPILDSIERRSNQAPKRRAKLPSEDPKGNPDVDAPLYFDHIFGPIAKDFRPTAAQVAYLQHVLSVVNDNTYNPVWVTLKSEFDKHFDKGPNRWLEILGMARAIRGRYIVAFEYCLPSGGMLYRPSSADAGIDQSFHYATPEQIHPRHGGRAMDLCDPGLLPSHNDLMPEFIHAHSHRKLAQVKIVGLGKTDAAVGQADVVNYRSRQRTLLANLWPQHAATISQWPN